MAGLTPFNHRKNNAPLARTGTGFEDFYNMLDDFFSDGLLSENRSLSRDTFKLDIEETETEYRVEAELPGIKKEEIELGVEKDTLTISVNRAEETGSGGKNYIHRERRAASVSRRVCLLNAQLDEVKAKLEEGVLTVTIPKEEKSVTSRKIEIE
ncbi:MAG: Hsp20 family protein [Clostridiales bacterium]|jgi:HSP20 family protein|nr:Hsp20 family protein [Clostridiales bacterium]